MPQTEPSELFAVGMILVAISIAKSSTDLQDAIDLWRRLHQGQLDRILSDDLRAHWDQLRRMKL